MWVNLPWVSRRYHEDILPMAQEGERITYSNGWKFERSQVELILNLAHNLRISPVGSPHLLLAWAPIGSEGNLLVAVRSPPQGVLTFSLWSV